MTKQDIIDYVVKTPSNTNPAVLDTMLNELSGGGGGGGSSDFSTAEVTLTTPGGKNYSIPNIVTNGGVSALINFYSPGGAGTFILNVPMYKGISGILLANCNFSVSGNAQKDGEVVYITGDCTITIS